MTLSLWIKGDAANGTLADSKVRVQFREPDGDRWNFDIGVELNNTNWQRLVIPFSTMIHGGSGNNVLEPAQINNFRFFNYSNATAVHFLVDDIQASTQ